MAHGRTTTASRSISTALITAPMSWASHHIRRVTHGFILTQDLGAIGSIYCLTMDPYEKYDMTFNGAVSTRTPTTSPGRYAGYDNGWVASLVSVPQMEFDKSIVDFPNIKRFPGGASNDMTPNLQDPANPLPLIDIKKVVRTIGAAD